MRSAIEMLNEKGISPSFNRIMIMDYLLSSVAHPTADEIYNEVKKSKANLSKMTIYNVLNIFEEKDLVRAVNISEKEVRFDATVNDHAHFKCRKCSSVLDIDVDYSHLKTNGLQAFDVDRRDVFFYGLCPKCCSKI
jgi:Fur family transcriptional regulator, peroxide stress response regulator